MDPKIELPKRQPGRPRGSRTKPRPTELGEALRRFKFDPLKSLVQMLSASEPADRVKGDLLVRLCEYIYPKKKSNDPLPTPVNLPTSSMASEVGTREKPPFDPGAFLEALEANAKGKT